MAKYIFHSEKTKTTCKECLKYDGEVFYNIKDLPQLPIHPNCKCWIETVENNSDKEKCDCSDRIEVLEDSTLNVIQNTKNLLEFVDKKAYDTELEFEIMANALEKLYFKKDIIEKEVGFHNKACKNNVDSLYKEMTQNIINAELLTKKEEDLSKELYELRRNLASFESKAKNNLLDIQAIKEHAQDFSRHTKQECKINEQLKRINIKTKELCEKINDYSIEYNQIKTKLNDVEKAVNSLEKCLELINKKKQTPCMCGASNVVLQGKTEKLVGKVEKIDIPNTINAGLHKGQEIKAKKTLNFTLQEYLLGLYNDYKGLEDPLNTIMYAVGVFLTNYFQLTDANTIGADKYFHAKANYEAAQQGIIGSLAAKIISDLREITDDYRNVKEKGYTKEYSQQDIKEDQQANEEGRLLGRTHPLTPAYDLLKKYIPNGFPERYKK